MKAIVASRYIIFTLTATLTTIIFMMMSCGPKPVSDTETVTPNIPYALKAITASESATISWQINLQDASKISGYNIYVADSPNSESELFNSAPYPGDTDDDVTRETYLIPRLENGHRYFVSVRTVFSDGSLSKPTSIVSFLPLAQGKLTISQNYNTDHSGFCFATEKYSRARDFENDIYIFATKTKSGISSPSRLHSSLRNTKISNAGGNYSQSQPLQKGNTYIIKTVDGGHAKLTLIEIKRSVPSIEATFKYIYYPPGLEPK